MDEIQRFAPFAQWLERLSVPSGFHLDQITVTSVDRFKSHKIGFMKLHTSVRHHDTSIPGVVFLRGPSSAILIVLHTRSGASYAVLTEQPRMAAPDFHMLELPAGMLDGGEFVGTSVKEIKEETGLTVEPHELVELTTNTALYPSPGACDEQLRLFVCEKHIGDEELGGIKDRLGGLRDEGELITVRLVPLADLSHVSDMKVLSALYLWQQQRKNLK
ncbi:NUDIX hydrolase domain-like protein [Coemansia spiralis]|nr:NUDIX hydrolase domain-like protein [Coemansia spiralis]